MSDFLDIGPAYDGGVNVGQYFGLWCVELDHFNKTWQRVRNMDLAQHIANEQGRISAADSDAQAREEFGRLRGDASIAVVNINGTMTKQGSSLGGGGTIRARRQIRAAANSNEIGGILLLVDSPGGTVSGTADLASDVAQANSKKPVFTFFEDLGASAAYWVGSQASKVFANDRSALVGSIGTFTVLYDMSKLAESEGVGVIVVKAGEFKGMGVPGTEITDEQIEKVQERIDAIQESFTAGVQRGRGMTKSQAQALVTGLVYTAPQAQELGLIDGIQSFDETVSQLQRAARKSTKERSKMSVETIQGATASELRPATASFDEIVGACAGIEISDGSDALFVADCLNRKLTSEQSQAEWMRTLKERSKSRDAELKAAQEAAAKAEQDAVDTKAEAERAAAAKLDGADTVGTTSEGAPVNDAMDEWNSAIAAKVKLGMKRRDAASAVNREHPELREAVVAASN